MLDAVSEHSSSGPPDFSTWIQEYHPDAVSRLKQLKLTDITYNDLKLYRQFAEIENTYWSNNFDSNKFTPYEDLDSLKNHIRDVYDSYYDEISSQWNREIMESHEAVACYLLEQNHIKGLPKENIEPDIIEHLSQLLRFIYPENDALKQELLAIEEN